MAICASGADNADYPLWKLLRALHHSEGSCWLGVRDGPCVEVRDVRGPDYVAVGGLAYPGYCRLLGVLMLCSRTATRPGSAAM